MLTIFLLSNEYVEESHIFPKAVIFKLCKSHNESKFMSRIRVSDRLSGV